MQGQGGPEEKYSTAMFARPHGHSLGLCKKEARMSLWERLRSIFGGAAAANQASVYAVQCGRCGEVIRVRADPRYDLNQDFDEASGDFTGYVLRKEVLGNRCPRLMQLEVRFDRGRRELSRSVEGGEFATPPLG
jgi:hypothetical protein